MIYIISLIVLVGIGLTIYFVNKNKKKKPQTLSLPNKVKVDTPPVAYNNTLKVSWTDGSITNEDLKYEDKDGDKLEAVRFTNTQGRLYLDNFYQKPYKDGKELSPDFRLYIRNLMGSYSVNYEVKTNGKWSRNN